MVKSKFHSDIYNEDKSQIIPNGINSQKIQK